MPRGFAIDWRFWNDRPLRLATIVAAGWLVAFGVATALAQRGALDSRILGDVVYVVPVAAAAVLSILAARAAQPHQRRFWQLLALSNLGWLCGELIWSFLELGLDQEVPFPSIADAFYLGSYLIVLPAAVIGFRPALATQLWRVMLDASIALAAIGYVGYTMLIEPQLVYGASWATATGVAYPLVGIAILVVLGLLASGMHGRLPLSTALVLLGFLVTAVTDTAYTYLTVLSEFVPGSWLNLGWQLEALLFCVAALVVIRRREERPRIDLLRRDFGMVIVLGGLAGAAVLVGIDLADGRFSVPGAMLAAFTFGSAFLRLYLTSREKTSIARTLDEHLREKEELVAQLEESASLLRKNAAELELGLDERRRAETMLERSLSRLHATLESTADGILVVDSEGRITDHNQRFAEMWGIPREILEAGDDEQALSSVVGLLADPESFIAKVTALYAEPYLESYDVVEFLDGRIYERFSKPQLLGGIAVGRVWSFRDVTEQRQLEESFRHAQKMEAVGRLAGGVAHDFNNLLMAISGYTDLVAENPAAAPVQYELDQIRLAADRAASLTRQLLAFGRKQVLQPVRLDLSKAVRGMNPLLRTLLGDDVGVVLRLPERVPLVMVDPGQMEQIIMNLAVNARDAMKHGGTLTIEVQHVVEPNGETVVLSVADTGTGMDAELRARVFEPFFTTKPLGEGTGLGLATVLGIVEQSGGSIDVESEPGAGSCFRVVLPVESGEIEAAA